MTNVSNLNLSKGTIPPLLKYKIVFLGDQAVGKSSIINRFIYDIFDGNDHRPTIGIDFISQNIFLEQKTIRLQLWDTASQQRFRTLIPSYIRDSSVAVIVYDVTNRASFESVRKWIDDVRNHHREEIVIAVLANKIDVEKEKREVSEEEGRKLAEENQVVFREVSAKSGVHVQEFFKEVAMLLPESGTAKSGNQGGMQAKVQVNSRQNDRIVLKPRDFTEDAQEQKAKRTGCC